MDRYRGELDFVASLMFLILLVIIIGLIVFLTGCTSPNPVLPPMPPGLAVSKNVAQPKLTAFVAPPPVPVTNITVTCDIGLGPWSGINLYMGMEPFQLSQIAEAIGTNIFTVTVPVSYPILLEARSFVLWPPPGVIYTSTNDDGSINSATNTYYENTSGADLIYVPPGCTNQWVFLNNDGTTTLAGWGLTNVTYQIQSGQLQSMAPVGTVIGTNGPWLHTATGEGPYWATKVVGP